MISTDLTTLISYWSDNLLGFEIHSNGKISTQDQSWRSLHDHYSISIYSTHFSSYISICAGVKKSSSVFLVHSTWVTPREPRSVVIYIGECTESHHTEWWCWGRDHFSRSVRIYTHLPRDSLTMLNTDLDTDLMK